MNVKDICIDSICTIRLQMCLVSQSNWKPLWFQKGFKIPSLSQNPFENCSRSERKIHGITIIENIGGESTAIDYTAGNCFKH